MLLFQNFKFLKHRANIMRIDYDSYCNLQPVAGALCRDSLLIDPFPRPCKRANTWRGVKFRRNYFENLRSQTSRLFSANNSRWFLASAEITMDPTSPRAVNVISRLHHHLRQWRYLYRETTIANVIYFHRRALFEIVSVTTKKNQFN